MKLNVDGCKKKKKKNSGSAEAGGLIRDNVGKLVKVFAISTRFFSSSQVEI